jgi:hypothetical protein
VRTPPAPRRPTLPQLITPIGRVRVAFDDEEVARCFSGASFLKRLSFIRACISPLAVGAPSSLCSMPEAR